MDCSRSRSQILGLLKSMMLLSTVFVMVSNVSSQTFNGGDNFLFPNTHKYTHTKESRQFTRSYLRRGVKLLNFCSQRQVQVFGNKINARGSHDSSNALFILKNAESKFGFYIIAENAKKFVCFNKKGKIILRVVGTTTRCLFDEVFSHNSFYSMLRNAFNSTWFIGFDRKGKPLSGKKYLNMQDKNCFYFLKRTDFGIKEFHKYRHSVGPNINPLKLTHFLKKEKLERKRRSRLLSSN